MPMTTDECYQALCARDRRFDGRFFVGVRSTGIYCRPVCPARTPLKRNVSFYPSAAAAEEAGFRACRRCRPETSPGTPVWEGTGSTVARALRIMRQEGAEGGLTIPALADRLGVGERHLRMLFAQHLGASPQAVLQTVKLDVARKLIDETNLPMTEIAFAAGFQSIRRFNDAVKKRFGEAPSALRQGRAVPEGSGALHVTLPYRPPFHAEALFSFLRQRAVRGLESGEGGAYSRTVRVGDAVGWVRVEAPATTSAPLRVSLSLSASQGITGALARVRHVFDLDADPGVVAERLSASPLLAPCVAAHPGLRIPGAWDGFEMAVRAVLGQQVSVAGAATLIGRVVALCGEALPSPGPAGLTHLFPSPQALLAARLDGIGITGGRIAALKDLAALTAAGILRFDGSMPDEAFDKALLGIKGIGPWTVAYLRMRALGDTDAFPGDDLIVKRAVAAAGAKTRASALAHAEAWRPWRSYATLYAWKAYECKLLPEVTP